jgi:DNA primase large subunit
MPVLTAKKKPYLPFFPLIIKYPFLKITGMFLEHEFGSIENMFNAAKRNYVVAEGVERGKKIVKSIVEGTEITFKDIIEDFSCFDCEIGCYKKCEIGFLSHECFSCSECFRNCSFESETEFYLKRKKDAIISAIGYLYSRILSSNLEDWVLRKYAVKESERYARIFFSEGIGVLKLISSDLGVKVRYSKDFKVHVSSYLKVAVKIKAPTWRLLNRRLKRGYIPLSKRDFLRVLEEHLRNKLSQREDYTSILKFDFIKEDIGEFKVIAERKREKLPKISFERIEVSDFPPCMRKILSDLQAGVNIPHTARFAITSFLLNLGMDIKEIIDLYKTAPDFDEDKTRYQVEHIAGAKGTEYETPSCETMKTYHNCFYDESCKGIYHPIQYYSEKIKKNRGWVKSKKAERQGK